MGACGTAVHNAILKANWPTDGTHRQPVHTPEGPGRRTRARPGQRSDGGVATGFAGTARHANWAKEAHAMSDHSGFPYATSRPDSHPDPVRIFGATEVLSFVVETANGAFSVHLRAVVMHEHGANPTAPMTRDITEGVVQAVRKRVSVSRILQGIRPALAEHLS